MTVNMGTLDRGLRVLAGIVLIILAFGTDFAATGVLHWVLTVAGAVMLLTAVIGYCPLYSAIGLRTCRAR
ncbi:YgaP family membrane protein [Frigidibacter oleivorans]|uniref:YgaP family membrane protein n=1 Tax=Frigidibacter oleivorans TaxID=2487129 RepID=UPI000F8D4141|nr:DUF2892 domain-containing protein [Frigidibacter oleivorans]